MGILGAAAISAVAGIGSAVIGSDASSSAADAQVQAANQASQTQLQMYDQTVAREQPWLSGGQNALAALMNGMGLQGGGGPNLGGGGGNQWDAYLASNPDVMNDYTQHVNHQQFPNPDAYAQWHYQHYGQNEGRQLPSGQQGPGFGQPQAPGFGSLTAPFTKDMFQQSPGYQYQMDQMMGAVQNSAAARGGLVSGNALRALQGNAGGLANQDWWNAQNNYQQQQQQKFNMLQTLSGGGQNAAANLGGLGSQVAGSIGNNMIGAGNAASAGIVAGGQNWSNLLNNQSFIQGISSLFGGGGGGFNAAGFDPAAFADPFAGGFSLPSMGTFG